MTKLERFTRLTEKGISSYYSIYVIVHDIDGPAPEPKFYLFMQWMDEQHREFEPREDDRKRIGYADAFENWLKEKYLKEEEV